MPNKVQRKKPINTFLFSNSRTIIFKRSQNRISWAANSSIQEKEPDYNVNSNNNNNNNSSSSSNIKKPPIPANVKGVFKQNPNFLNEIARKIIDWFENSTVDFIKPGEKYPIITLPDKFKLTSDPGDFYSLLSHFYTLVKNVPVMSELVKEIMAIIKEKYPNNLQEQINKSFPGVGFTLLSFFIISKDYDSVKLLLQSGADLNQLDSSGQTPLYYLFDIPYVLKRYDHAPTEELIDLLLKYHADFDFKKLAEGKKEFQEKGTKVRSFVKVLDKTNWGLNTIVALLKYLINKSVELKKVIPTNIKDYLRELEQEIAAKVIDWFQSFELDSSDKAEGVISQKIISNSKQYDVCDAMDVAKLIRKFYKLVGDACLYNVVREILQKMQEETKQDLKEVVNKSIAGTGVTLLTFVMISQHYESIEFLLKAGANPNLENGHNLVPVYYIFLGHDLKKFDKPPPKALIDLLIRYHTDFDFMKRQKDGALDSVVDLIVNKGRSQKAEKWDFESIYSLVRYLSEMKIEPAEEIKEFYKELEKDENKDKVISAHQNYQKYLNEGQVRPANNNNEATTTTTTVSLDQYRMQID